MINEFIENYMKNKHLIEKQLLKNHPKDYKEIVHLVIKSISDDEDSYDSSPDPYRIHEINDGNHEGTLVFVIASKGHDPYNYWYIKVGYGSCNVCDTLERIKAYDNSPPTKEQIADYMMLCLHVVQGIKKMSEESV